MALPTALPIAHSTTLRRSGDPAADWDLLQRISFSNPEAFWPHVLRLLRIRFHKLPHRWGAWTHKAAWPAWPVTESSLQQQLK